MVEVGSLEIGGSIQTEDIESGLTRIQHGFDNVGSKTEGLNADFVRMANEGARLNKIFLGMAIGGATAMIAIAKGAPAVAGSMAKIKVQAGELSRSLGRALAPAFDMVSDAFERFVGWMEENEESINYFSTNILGGFIDALEGIKTAWTWITDNVNDFLVKIGVDWNLGDVGQYLLDHFGPEVVAGMIGAGIGGVIAGPPGAAVGAIAGAGAVYAGRRIEDPQLFLQESFLARGILNILARFSQSQQRKVIGVTLTDQT